MSDKRIVLTRDEMRAEYGRFYDRSERQELNMANIPAALWALVPYAEFWGVLDDLDRERLVMEAPRDVLDNLVAVVRAFDDQLDIWLAGPEAKSRNFSREYIAFSTMRMAADFA